MNKIIDVETVVGADARTVWDALTLPKHIVNWNFASPEWECPRADSDLRPGGRFNYRMQARAGGQGFDLAGTFDNIVPRKRLDYTLDDGRKVSTVILQDGDKTKVTTSFKAENTFSEEHQRAGWQSILDNMKKYIERGLKP